MDRPRVAVRKHRKARGTRHLEFLELHTREQLARC